MSAPLADCTIVEQHDVIQVLWSEGVEPSDSQKNVSIICRKLYYIKEGVPMGGKVPKW
jgi:hypothetical protein